MSQENLEVPDVGQIRFFDRVTPPLTRGNYTLEVEQNLDPGGQNSSGWRDESELGSDADLSASHFFEVTGPRWKINPLLIHSVTPPKNEQGVLVKAELPKIVFQRKTLPWENQPNISGGEGHPWMALLLLKDDEVISINKVEKDAGVALSNVYDAETLNQMNASNFGGKLVDTVELLTNKATSILPTKDELKLLAHAAMVNPMDKELCGSDEDGWFSIVMGNRLATEANTEYHACLVSIEGREDLLPTLASDDFNSAPPPDAIRTVGFVERESIDDSHDPLNGHSFDNEKLTMLEEILPDSPRPANGPQIGGSPPINPPVDPRMSTDIGQIEMKNASDVATGHIGNANIGSGELNISNQLDSQASAVAENIQRENISGASGTTVKRNFLSLFNVLLADVGGAGIGGISAKSESATPSPGLISRLTSKITKASPSSGQTMSADPSYSISSFYQGPPIHFVLLHHWKFKTGDGGDFEARMKGLRVRQFNGTNAGELHSVPELESNSAAPALLGNSMVPNIVGDSYLKTEIIESDGTLKPCIYRGPCVGEQLNHENKEKPYSNSDDAKGITELDGEMIDEISHAAAFELGRLLAMSDTRFTKLISRWRRMEYVKKAKKSNLKSVESSLSFGDLNQEIDTMTSKLIHRSLNAEIHEKSLQHVDIDKMKELAQNEATGIGPEEGVTNPGGIVGQPSAGGLLGGLVGQGTPPSGIGLNDTVNVNELANVLSKFTETEQVNNFRGDI